MKSKNISRRQFLKKSSIATTMALTLPMILNCNLKKRKPNIIFFIADDMRPGMFNCLPGTKGKNLTPNIDFLAREGTLMMEQVVASPVCTPSRFNCLTGRYASRARNRDFLNRTEKEGGQTVVQWNSFITEQDITLPKLLKQAGYSTGMVGKNHVVEVTGLYTFPSYDGDPKNPEIKENLKQNSDKIKAAIHKSGFDYVASVYHNNPNFIGLSELAVQNLDWITKGGIDFIEQYKDNPFFLYFATTVPHSPTEAKRSWNANPLITADGYLENPLDVLPHRHTIPERLKQAGISESGKENVLWLDDSLGALINKLKEHGLDNNTIIFFFNDHGQNAKGTIYQGGIHNPSIIWKKGGFKCGSICNVQVSNIDFAPTILDFVGFDYQDISFDGKSFRSVLEGKNQKIHHSLYFELGYVRGILKDNWKYIALRYPPYAYNMSLDERTKLLKNYNDDREFRKMVIINRDPTKPFSHLSVIPGGGHAEYESTGKVKGYYDSDQLYDLSKDKEEQVNLAKDQKYQDKLVEMKLELKKYLKDLPGLFQL